MYKIKTFPVLITPLLFPFTVRVLRETEITHACFIGPVTFSYGDFHLFAYLYWTCSHKSYSRPCIQIQGTLSFSPYSTFMENLALSIAVFLNLAFSLHLKTMLFFFPFLPYLFLLMVLLQRLLFGLPLIYWYECQWMLWLSLLLIRSYLP